MSKRNNDGNIMSSNNDLTAAGGAAAGAATGAAGAGAATGAATGAAAAAAATTMTNEVVVVEAHAVVPVAVEVGNNNHNNHNHNNNGGAHAHVHAGTNDDHNTIDEDDNDNDIPFVTATLLSPTSTPQSTTAATATATAAATTTTAARMEDYSNSSDTNGNIINTYNNNDYININNDDNVNVTWCWEETPSLMSSHTVDEWLSHGVCCCYWIKYPLELQKEIETAYNVHQQQRQQGHYNRNNSRKFRPSLLPGYELNFETMTQTNITTGFCRNILRHHHGRDHHHHDHHSSSSRRVLPTASSSAADDYVDDASASTTTTPTTTTTTTPNPPSNSTTTPTICWCWKETSHLMSSHTPDEIFLLGNNNNDPDDCCWIKYSQKANEELENAYQRHLQPPTWNNDQTTRQQPPVATNRVRTTFQQQQHTGACSSCSPLPGYVVYFDTMCQVKLSTGFQRDVKRFVLAAADEEGMTSYMQCPYCDATIEYPKTMTKTPFIYCCSCERTCLRDILSDGASKMIESLVKWHICPYCKVFGEIKSFEREKRVYVHNGTHSDPGIAYLDRIEEWRVNNCCCRCAKYVLYHDISKHQRQPVRGQSCEGYQISHALRTFQKWNDPKYIGNRRRGHVLKEQVERPIHTYGRFLPGRKLPPELHYAVARSCLLRRDLDGAEAAINTLLRTSCANFMPAVDVLEELLELRLKEEGGSLPDKSACNGVDYAVSPTRRLDSLYQDFLANVDYFRRRHRSSRDCWYRDERNLREFRGLPPMNVTTIWQRKPKFILNRLTCGNNLYA